MMTNRYPHIEHLQPRRLLALSVATINIAGSPGDDVISLGFTNPDKPALVVTNNGHRTVLPYDTSKLTGIVIACGDGKDIVRPDDSLFAADLSLTILGGTGNDTLIGANGILHRRRDRPRLRQRPRADLLLGGTGDDTIHGGAQGDLIEGGFGNDLLLGNGGNDRIFGGPGFDTIFGGLGNNTIYGGGGDDVILGNGGNDAINGGSGDDLIDGAGGADAIDGSSGDDTLTGGGGGDKLTGGSGNDDIAGNQGNDNIAGDGGDDHLRGRRRRRHSHRRLRQRRRRPPSPTTPAHPQTPRCSLSFPLQHRHLQHIHRTLQRQRQAKFARKKRGVNLVRFCLLSSVGKSHCKPSDNRASYRLAMDSRSAKGLAIDRRSAGWCSSRRALRASRPRMGRHGQLPHSRRKPPQRQNRDLRQQELRAADPRGRALLAEGKTTLKGVPRLSDIDSMIKLLGELGCHVYRHEPGGETGSAWRPGP